MKVQEDKLKKTAFRLSIDQIRYIKTIDKNNASSAIRKIIKEHQNFRRTTDINNAIITIATGLILVMVGSLVTNIYISITSYIVGGVLFFTAAIKLIQEQIQQKRFKKNEPKWNKDNIINVRT